jgi:DNA-binding protein HU-beta
MSQQDLVSRVSALSSEPKSRVKLVLAALGDATQDLMRDGQDVVLPGIGKLKRTLRQARTARNPKTGDPIKIAERHVPTFKPAPALKGAC